LADAPHLRGVHRGDHGVEAGLPGEPLPTPGAWWVGLLAVGAGAPRRGVGQAPQRPREAWARPPTEGRSGPPPGAAARRAPAGAGSAPSTPRAAPCRARPHRAAGPRPDAKRPRGWPPAGVGHAPRSSNTRRAMVTAVLAVGQPA